MFGDAFWSGQQSGGGGGLDQAAVEAVVDARLKEKYKIEDWTQTWNETRLDALRNLVPRPYVYYTPVDIGIGQQEEDGAPPQPLGGEAPYFVCDASHYNRTVIFNAGSAIMDPVGTYTIPVSDVVNFLTDEQWGTKKEIDIHLMNKCSSMDVRIQAGSPVTMLDRTWSLNIMGKHNTYHTLSKAGHGWVRFLLNDITDDGSNKTIPIMLFGDFQN